MKTIIITGTPCTGKTTLAKMISKRLGFYYIDANEIIKKYDLAEGFDNKRKSKIVDTAKLNNALIKEIKTTAEKIRKPLKEDDIKDAIKENSSKQIPTKKTSYGKIPINKDFNKRIQTDKTNNNKNHASKFNGIIIDSHLSHYLPRKYSDLCIVARCGIKELGRRLKNRRYSAAKIQENLQSEIFDICLIEANENRHNVFEIDTTHGIKINKLINKIKRL